MDNLAHSLVGAALAEAGLAKKTPLGTATLILAANMADIDGLAMLVGSDYSLQVRRGWTHGVLAWVVLPAVLVGIMLLWDRLVRRRRHPTDPPVDVGWLVGLAYLGFLTHPLLDWMNTYGVRLLMPFDGQWFYGDSLFIVDPWLWLLGASSVVLAHSSSRLSAAAWIVLGAAASALVLGFGQVPTVAKAVWMVGVAGIAAVRIADWVDLPPRRLARFALAAMVAYIAAMVAGTAYSTSMATDRFEDQGLTVEHVMAGPVPADPFVRQGLVRAGHEYRFFKVDPTADDSFVETHPGVTVDSPGPVVEAALHAPQIDGFRHWMRFPSWDVHRLDDGGYRVIFRDLRYVAPDADDDRGIGMATVELDEHLQPRFPRGD